MANIRTDYTFNEMLNLTWSLLKEEWYERGPTKNFLSDFYHDCLRYNQLGKTEVTYIALIAIIFTLHRYIITKFFINPVVRMIGFTKKDSLKFTESVCKELYYFCLYAYTYYLILYKYSGYRYNISSQWTGVTQNIEVPFDILLIYMVEAGFYFHSIYATVFMDEWKKDSIAMLLHHILANALILFSLSFRYHRVGLVVLYLHDVADILLEGTKIIVCLKNRFPSRFLEGLSVIGFLSFTFSWFWCRLWLYPQIVLFSTGYVARMILPQANFYFLFNVMLWCLQCLNVWWFHFIIMLIVRIATGQSRTVEDTRSYEEKEHAANKETANGHVIKTKGVNGSLKQNNNEGSRQGENQQVRSRK